MCSTVCIVSELSRTHECVRYTGEMIGLMDCNNFFVSCERLFRPDLHTKPVLVLSSNDGCVIARSQEVKDMGISMGMPFFQIKDICHSQGVHVFSSNFKLYRDLSYRVIEALRSEFPRCEVYSIDEAFFDVLDTVSVSDIQIVRARIIEKTGIPISFGIGRTKTIAKVASQFAKKDAKGVAVLIDGTWVAVMPQVSCGMVWGIGRRMVQILRDHGIHTVSDLCAKGQVYLQNVFGVVGERIYLELNEKAVYRVGGTVVDAPKSMVSSRSFGARTYEKKVLVSALSHHVSCLGVRLRREGMLARSMRIICDACGEMGGRSLSVYFDTPTQSTKVLIHEAIRLLDTIYTKGVCYRKAGVYVDDLIPTVYASVVLFDDATTRIDTVIDGVVDTLNTHFGVGTVERGVSLFSQKWGSLHKMSSPAYTTDWRQIPIVKAV